MYIPWVDTIEELCRVGDSGAGLGPDLAAIDTSVYPLYMLTGEYDFSCAPEDTKVAAALIDGARVVIMEGLAHVPMSEDPARFRTYLTPVLDEIRE